MEVNFTPGSMKYAALRAHLLTELPLLPADPSTTLWYQQPATSSSQEGLPIGNGRIALNEESVWSGARTNWNRKGASQNLPKIREPLLAGTSDEAEALVNQSFTRTKGGNTHFCLHPPKSK